MHEDIVFFSPSDVYLFYRQRVTMRLVCQKGKRRKVVDAVAVNVMKSFSRCSCASAYVIFRSDFRKNVQRCIPSSQGMRRHVCLSSIVARQSLLFIEIYLRILLDHSHHTSKIRGTRDRKVQWKAVRFNENIVETLTPGDGSKVFSHSNLSFVPIGQSLPNTYQSFILTFYQCLKGIASSSSFPPCN